MQSDKRATDGEPHSNVDGKLRHRPRKVLERIHILPSDTGNDRLRNHQDRESWQCHYDQIHSAALL